MYQLQDLPLIVLGSMFDPIKLVAVGVAAAMWVRSARSAVIAGISISVGFGVLMVALSWLAETPLPGLLLVGSVIATVMLCALGFGVRLWWQSRGSRTQREAP